MMTSFEGTEGFNTMVRNILDTWDRATDENRREGQTWYKAAHDIAAGFTLTTGHPIDYVAAVISHLSPKTNWKRNIQAARDVLNGINPTYALKANVARANATLESRNPLMTFGKGAKKTQRFARNILGDREAVTVDVWAQRVAQGKDADPKFLKRNGGYESVERAYQVAANQLGEYPSVVQATTWIVARNGRSQ